MFSDKENFKQVYLIKLMETEISLDRGPLWDKYKTLVTLLKEKIISSRALTKEESANKKRVYYFSMEFLLGRLLHYYLVNMGIEDLVREGLNDIGLRLDDLLQQERDPGLGNGGLGRLAACFLDSMAFTGIAGHGNGIRFKYGLFEQRIVNGFQYEVADNWAKDSYPWETRKPDKSIVVKFKGNIRIAEEKGKLQFYHENYEAVLAVPSDIPIISYENRHNINNLRLWSAEPLSTGLDLVSFNRGEFQQAAGLGPEIEAISYVLYPDDSTLTGRELRLKQAYFFVAAGLGSIIRAYKKRHNSLTDFSRWVAVHINDTHPVLAIPELMRILIDEEGLDWDHAWNITANTISFTNHTILPEALEKWPIDLFRSLLPRIYMIIEEIDRRFREKILNRYPDEPELFENTRIIKDGLVWMANLAIIGSSSVNGVAALHTKILKKEVFQHYYRVFGYKFNNKTNGVNHRRFLLTANRGLSDLITEAIGPAWKKDARELRKLNASQKDSSFLKKLAAVKHKNKECLAKYVWEKQGLKLDPSSMFDVQVKRIHAYKRQLLNVLKIIHLYNTLLASPSSRPNPRTFIFAGKAAPGYRFAKTVIKLINTLAQKINNDPRVNEIMKVVFLENFNVSLGELVYPAADLSEQISTASQEASGTGNMKFMFNGALTIGTLDGANVEIRQVVGKDNIFIFGLTAEEVLTYIQNRNYRSWDEYYANQNLKLCLDQLVNGFFDDPTEEFRLIFDALLIYGDDFFVLKDFNSYLEAYSKAESLYSDRENWSRKSLINIAEAGIFSSDRTIRQYADRIWRIKRPY
ncbi:MAG TPA: glycogen/starch/alpha-glucan phosphorylase [Desulfitobacteriaceae bacterium]|nr:glycogen/starch/alpha-glucan phosphorylase [Desulfitobacteriaceae bacterium]